MSIRRHLIEGGRLVLDLFNPSLESLASRQEGQEFGDEPEFSTPDGRRVVRRHRTVAHDRFNQVNHVELIYYVTHPDGREERLVHAFPMRYLFRFEVEHLLVRCGFDVEQLYAGFDKGAYGSRYPGELIFVARKTTGTVEQAAGGGSTMTALADVTAQVVTVLRQPLRAEHFAPEPGPRVVSAGQLLPVKYCARDRLAS